MTAYHAWSAFPAGTTWEAVAGVVSFAGLMGNGAPNEVVIQPERSYDSSVAGLAQQGSDMFAILSVAEVLKPAASIVSVDMSGAPTAVAVQPSFAWADSQYWEIIQLVTPSSPSAPAYQQLTASYQAGNADELPPGTYVIPKPPLSRSTGAQYSYAADVTTAAAAAVTGDDPNSAVTSDGQDFETVVFPGGRLIQYLPGQAIMPPAQSRTVRTASPVSVLSAPWSGPRSPVVRAS